MNLKRNKEKNFTLPGEKIAVIEEFLPGHGTYEKDGSIYASIIGDILVNKIEKTIAIKQKFKPQALTFSGNPTVLGLVNSYQERMASVGVFKIEKKSIHPHFSAILHISNSSSKYERAMEDVCKRGDIIKAKVIEFSRNLVLSTNRPDLGVIKAYCSKCGASLKLKSGSSLLHCNNCKKIEKRKIADSYMKGIEK